MKGLATTRNLQLVTQNSNKFSMDLYMSLKNDIDEDSRNKIISPLGLQIVLAMTAYGARGKTKQELLKAMHFPRNSRTLLSGYQALQTALKAPELEIANNIYLNNGSIITILPEFQRAMLKYFSSRIEKVSMQDDPELAASKMNKWVEEHTQGKFKDFFNTGDLLSAEIVLVNAIYFKAKWERPFSPAEEDAFFISGIRHEVEMMSIKSWFKYGYISELQSKILELPYKNGQFSMVLILPDDYEGLSEVEKRLHTMGLSEAIRYMEAKEVDVKMPKFKIEADLNLNGNLEELGITEIFRECDLSGMVRSENPLKVSNVIQKAFIEVEEEGTEAAAVTAVITRESAMPGMQPPEDDPEVFIADHPFFYAIYAHEGSVKVPIFVGSVTDPSN